MENTDGKWVLLTKEAMQQFHCPDDVESGYVLAYNAEDKQELLEHTESSSTVSEYLDPFLRMKKQLIAQGIYWVLKQSDVWVCMGTYIIIIILAEVDTE